MLDKSTPSNENPTFTIAEGESVVLKNIVCLIGILTAFLDAGYGSAHKTKRIVCTQLHPRVADSLSHALKEIGGYELCLFSTKCKPVPELLPPNYPWPFHHDAPEQLPARGLLNTSDVVLIENFQNLLTSPPDILLVSADTTRYQDYGYYNLIWGDSIKRGETKVVYFSGFVLPTPPARFRNHLCIDGSIYNPLFKQSMPHRIAWTPWIDHENTFKFDEPSDSLSLGTYIHAVSAIFPKSYAFYQEIQQELKAAPWSQELSFQLCNGKTPFTQIPKIMDSTFATIHIKDIEGFGYAILESMFKGKPVFLYLTLEDRNNHGKFRCLDWCEEGSTAYLFSSKEELYEKLRPFVEDLEYRREAQRRCALRIRQIIDFDAEKNRLKQFLDNLLPQIR